MDTREIEVDGEKLHLKKDFLGWRIITPLKNPDGTYNWWSVLFGGKKNALILLGLLAAIGVFIFVYYNDITSLKVYYESICNTTQKFLVEQ